MAEQGSGGSGAEGQGPAENAVAPEPLRIFVSYRREDTRDLAGRLHDRLSDRFANENVFIDVDTIEPGLDFRVALREAVGSCDALVAVIGRRWTGRTLLWRRRIDRENDYVRMEVEAALARDVRVVPVLVEDTEMPPPDDLPAPLAGLAYRNALTIRHASFHADASRLIVSLERLEREKAAHPGTGLPREEETAVLVPRRVTRHRRRRFPRRGALVAAGILLAAAVSALVAALALSGGSAASLQWESVSDDPGVLGGPGDQKAVALAPLGPASVVAVGYGGSTPGRMPLAWVYAGGRWSRDRPIAQGARFESLEAVAAGESRIVAGGAVGETSTPTQAATWWREASGSEWTRACLPDGGCASSTELRGHSTVRGLLALPQRHGFVAVGAQATQKTGGTPRAAVWTSTDGASWEPAWQERTSSRMNAVTRIGAALVAVGIQSLKPAIWRSTDEGATWQRVPSQDLAEPGELRGVAALGQTVVAGGSAPGSSQRCGENEGTVFRSTDGGLHWSREGRSSFDVTGQLVADVAVFADRFVAVGYDHDKDCAQVAAVWSSRDGASWTRDSSAPFERSSLLQSGIAVGDLWLAVGDGPSERAGERDAAIWRATRP